MKNKGFCAILAFLAHKKLTRIFWAICTGGILWDFFFNFYKVYRAQKGWNCSCCNLFEVYPNFELELLAYIGFAYSGRFFLGHLFWGDFGGYFYNFYKVYRKKKKLEWFMLQFV